MALSFQHHWVLFPLDCSCSCTTITTPLSFAITRCIPKPSDRKRQLPILTSSTSYTHSCVYTYTWSQLTMIDALACLRLHYKEAALRIIILTSTTRKRYTIIFRTSYHHNNIAFIERAQSAATHLSLPCQVPLGPFPTTLPILPTRP